MRAAAASCLAFRSWSLAFSGHTWGAGSLGQELALADVVLVGFLSLLRPSLLGLIAMPSARAERT